MFTLDAFQITKVPESRLKPGMLDQPVFGQLPTDHMFMARYKDGQWEQGEILPFQPIQLSPFTSCLHYAQTVFEGMKAFRMNDGNVNIFRLDRHHTRLELSLNRMAMPSLPQELFREGILQLLDLDRNWVPDSRDAALYVRPFVFASEAQVGAKPANEFLYMVVCFPVVPLFQKAIRVKVETHYRRAAPGGTGAAKCGGNYAGSFYPTKLALEQGFHQVIWTDGSPEFHVEESGTMNLMFVIDGKLVTPPLSDTILDGITRDSLLHIARAEGISVDERQISTVELFEAYEKGILQEAFGAGTAVVVAPIEEIVWEERAIHLPPVTENSIQMQLKKSLENIRRGNTDDPFGWNNIV
jgi:branched-chain amino acid aminotransferase